MILTNGLLLSYATMLPSAVVMDTSLLQSEAPASFSTRTRIRHNVFGEASNTRSVIPLKLISNVRINYA